MHKKETQHLLNEENNQIRVLNFWVYFSFTYEVGLCVGFYLLPSGYNSYNYYKGATNMNDLKTNRKDLLQQKIGDHKTEEYN